MSRIGKLPVNIPDGVKIDISDDNVVTVKGKLGELSQKINKDIKLEIDGNTINLKRPSDSKEHKSFHGLYRVLVNNMIIGVSEGFEKKLEVIGVGYRATANGQLLELNVSKVTAENLVKNDDQELIEKWIEAINYSNASDKAAYIVKAIRENWQFPEDYLKGKREEQRKEEEEKIEYIKIKLQEEENKKRREEIKKIEKIYNSLDPSQKEEIRIETEKRLPDFWKEKLNKARAKGTTSKLLEVVLEEKRREIIKEWINNKK